jgi:15-cis-phytoene synthase
MPPCCPNASNGAVITPARSGGREGAAHRRRRSVRGTRGDTSATRAEVATLFGSSEYRALSDDGLKDEDNASWVLSLDDGVRGEWVRRIRWIRLVDRLAENEWFEPEARRFGAFIESFGALLHGAPIDERSPHADVLAGVRDDWLRVGEVGARAQALTAWVDYLGALSQYHHPAIHIATLDEHDEMLFRLSGRIFQLVPFLDEGAWGPAGEFGRLDQFFNNLRDLEEDGASGVCYFPADVLERFGLSEAAVCEGSCVGRAGYAAMMRFWLDEHLPVLRERAAPFLGARGLHPSVAVMREHTIARHARIERVFREVEFDFHRFRERYWAEVRAGLASAASR